MKKLLVIFCLISSISFGQDNCRIGIEVIYPSGFGTSDMSLNASFLGNYPGQYTMYKRANPSPAVVGNTFTSLDSATMSTVIGYEFYATDDQSGDTICMTNVLYLINPFSPYYGTIDSVIFIDTIISPMTQGDCNGIYSYSKTLNTSTSDWQWRPSTASGTPWFTIDSGTSTPKDSLCAGQHWFAGGSGAFVFMQWTYIQPQITNTPSFQLNASTTPSSVGSCTGEATAQVSGATAPLTYIWDGNVGAITETALCPGLHNLKVIDANLDSVTTVFGIADSANYFLNSNSGNAADSVYVLVENCNYNFNITTDSVTIDNVQGISATEVIVTFSLWQMGTPTTMIDTALVVSSGAPAWYIDITVYCYTKIVGSNIVKYVATQDKTDLSITASESSQISIYPNPSNNLLFIKSMDFEKVVIYNALGEIVVQSTEQTIDVSAFSSGLYQVMIYNKSERPTVLKFIRE